MILLIIVTILSTLHASESLRALTNNKISKKNDQVKTKNGPLLDLMQHVASARREGELAQMLYDSIVREQGKVKMQSPENMHLPQPKKKYRGDDEISPVLRQQVKQVENELNALLMNKKSAVFVHPTYEKLGAKDYLSFPTDRTDRFQTVIPNDIHYAIQKSCVNWLDDCSVNSIKQRLIAKVNWPYGT